MKDSLIKFEARYSDSAFVDTVWRSHSERAGVFHSMACCNWGIVVTRYAGKTFLTVRGPETRATVAECPAEGEWFGIQFKVGTFMPALPTSDMRDRNDVTLPEASSRSFWLNGSAWEYPTFENAEAFVRRLLAKGIIVEDPRVVASLRGAPRLHSQRTEQRRFQRATGLTQAAARQIERARRAVYDLSHGVDIGDVVHDLGYFDQPHLTRSLKHFAGQTPGQIVRGESQLSLLYKTDGT